MDFDLCHPQTLNPTAVPKFTREPSDVALDIGSDVTLGCLAQGYPDPQITWRREDGRLLFNRPRTEGSVTQSKAGLHITRRSSLLWKLHALER